MWPQNTKILVIDDFAAMRERVRQYLSGMSLENVHLGTGGEDGWQKFLEAKEQGEPFELILSDWNMPEVTGLDLLRRIRQDSELGKTAFVMITAEGGMDQVLEAAKAGVTEYVAKPLDQHRLETKLKAVFDKLNRN